MHDSFHTIASLALVRVNPNNGEIIEGSFHCFVADVYEDGFGRIDPAFDEAKTAAVLENALVLRYSGLYPEFVS